MDAKSREIVKSLAELAWADGVVSPDERALLLRILVEAGTDPDDVQEFDHLLAAPSADVMSEPANLADLNLDQEGKHNVMRALLIMSFMDGTLSFAEFDHLERVAQELELTDDELDVLRTEAISAAETLKAEA